MYAKLRIIVRHKKGASAGQYVLRDVPMVLHIEYITSLIIERETERKREIRR